MSNKMTGKQQWYLKKLLNEAFAKRYTTGLCLDVHHLEGTTFEYARTAIAQLVQAKNNGWRQS